MLQERLEDIRYENARAEEVVEHHAKVEADLVAELGAAKMARPLTVCSCCTSGGVRAF